MKPAGKLFLLHILSTGGVLGDNQQVAIEVSNGSKMGTVRERKW